MLVQINTDKILKMNEAYTKQLEASLKEYFSRFRDQIISLRFISQMRMEIKTHLMIKNV